MSFILLLAATLSTQTATVSSETQSAPARRSGARAVAVASATIIRLEKVSPLAKEIAPTSAVERPIAKQRSVKKGVPYVEFY